MKFAVMGGWVVAITPPQVPSPPSTVTLENGASRLMTYKAFVAVACGEISSVAISCVAAELTGAFV